MDTSCQSCPGRYRTGHLWFQLVFVALIFDFQFWSLSGIIIFSDPNHIHIIESASYFVRKPGIWRLLQGSGTRCRWISRGTGAHGRSDVNMNRWLSGTVWNNNFENIWKTCWRNMLSIYCCPGNRCELHVTGTLVQATGAWPQKPLWASEWTPWRSLRLSWSHHLLNLLTLLTILPSSFFSPCGQSEAKTINKNKSNATNQKPTCCASQFRSRPTLFDLWYGSCVDFCFASWQLSCRLVDPGIPPRMECFPAVSWYTLEGLTALAKTQKSWNHCARTSSFGNPYQHREQWMPLCTSCSQTVQGNSCTNTRP